MTIIVEVDIKWMFLQYLYSLGMTVKLSFTLSPTEIEILSFSFQH